ncbi:TetR/AcrR family transcriptional regulator [Prauserella cavernicola]|uniref:TetR/AcrR family transcriptional regulator n=1 Tax=Prauserella cavernicola TaxID=2800127 RepID=A0A934QSB4_9PSEU|nr:TetR/AcrR family transcriptional regulator [Prauserella cavernicola]MBK1785430.1 TetR/AcrR family transcriptional regulator [Prauserella cavernicola]
MPRRTDTRDRMLSTAAELFHTQGYHATGLNQLLSAGAAPKGSLYFHFPGGKEQLAAEALAISGGRLRDALADVLDRANGLGAAVEMMIDFLATTLEDSDFQRGCPLSTVALDAAGSEPIRQACVEGFGSWQALLENALTAEGVAADRAESLAVTTLAAVEGALLLAKTRRDSAPLRAVAAHLRETVERELS